MDYGKYKITLDPNLLVILVECKSESVRLKDVIEIRDLIKNSTNKNYLYTIFTRLPCYYFSYVIDGAKIICSGKMVKKDCIEETKTYINENMCN